MGRLLRRSWRIAWRVGLGLAAAALVAVLAALVLAHTDTGRDWLRGRVQAALDDGVDGGVTIGRLEGSVLGSFTLREVTVTGPDGEEAVVIDALSVDARWWSLLRKRVRLRSVEATGVSVHLRPLEDGRLNLAALVPPDDDHEPSGPSSWRVDVEAFALRGQVSWHGPDGDETLRQLTLTGAVTVAGGQLDATARLDGTWTRHDAPVALSARAHVDADHVRISDLRASVAEASAAAESLTWQGERLEGALTFELPPPAWRLVPELEPPPGGARGTLRFAPAAADQQLGLEVDAGGARLSGTLRADLAVPKVAGTLTVERLDAAAFGAPLATAVDAEVELDVTGAAPDELTGSVTITGRGEIDWYRVEHARAELTLANRSLRLDAGAGGPGDARATLTAAVTRRPDGTWQLSDSHLVATARDLGAASGGRAPARGDLAVDLRAQGIAEDLAVRGSLRADRLRHADHAVRGLVVDVDLADLPSLARGHVRARAAAVRLGGEDLGPLRVRADSADGGRRVDIDARLGSRAAPVWAELSARIHPGPERVVVEVGRGRGHARGVTARLHGGRVIVEGDERVVARAVRVSLGGGRAEVGGAYWLAGRRAGDLEATFAVDALPVDALAALAGDEALGGARGALSTSGTAALRRGRLHLDASFRADQLVAQHGLPAITAAGLARLQPGRLVAELEARGGGATVSLEADVAAPTDAADVEAWRRLDQSDVRVARVVITALDVPTWTAALGAEEATALAGVVDAELDWRDGAGSGELSVRGARAPDVPVSGDARLSFELGGTAAAPLLSLAAEVDAGATLRARARARLRAPARLLSPDAWRALDETAVQSARVRLDHLVVDDPLAAWLGVEDGWRGRFAGQITADEGLTGADVRLLARELRSDLLHRPTSVDLRGRVAPDGLHADVRVALRDLAIARAVAEVRVTPSALIATRGEALATAPLRATLTIDDASLAATTQAAGLTTVTDGRVSALVQLDGTSSAPRLTAEVGVRDAVVAGVGVPEVQAELEATPRAASATLLARDGGGGRLRVAGRTELSGARRAAADLRLENFQVGAIAELLPDDFTRLRGLASGRARLGGTLAEPHVEGTLALREGRLPLGGELGTVEDASLDLELTRVQARARLRGRLGGGRVAVQASAPIGADGLPASATARVELRRASIAAADLRPTIDANVDVKARRGDERWEVDVTTRDGSVVVDREATRALHPTSLPDDVVFADADEGTATIHRGASDAAGAAADSPPIALVRIRARNIMVRSDELRTRVDTDLELSVGAEVAVIGTVRADEGFVTIFGRRYRIVRAVLRFDGTDDPAVDVELAYTFPSLTLTVAVRGTLENPELRLTSDAPGYDESQLLSFVLGASPDTAVGGETQGAAAGVAAAIISNELTGLFDRVLPIDPDVTRIETATAARRATVTTGWWITARLFLAYRYRVSALGTENASEAQFEYWLRRNILLEGHVGDRGYHETQLVWIRRY